MSRYARFGTGAFSALVSLSVQIAVPLQAHAQTYDFHLQDVIADASMCVGNGCITSGFYGFGAGDLVLKDGNVALGLEDTSTAMGYPARDWQITINDFFYGGADYFAIRDLEADTLPFFIEGSAPDHSLYVDKTGRIGLGTWIPEAAIHVAGALVPTIRLDVPAITGPARIWDLYGANGLFGIKDSTSGNVVLAVSAGAPHYALFIAADGNVGLGTFTPAAPLEISDDDTFSFFRITATDAPTTKSVDFVFTKGPKGTGELRYNLVDGDGPEMRLDADGNMLLDGALTQNSDRNAKTAIEPIDPGEILDKVAALPVSEWSYIDGNGVRHIGPMAQDFHALFGTGASATGISTLDTSGVALAAIQALRAENAALAEQNGAILARLEALEAALAAQ